MGNFLIAGLLLTFANASAFAAPSISSRKALFDKVTKVQFVSQDGRHTLEVWQDNEWFGIVSIKAEVLNDCRKLALVAYTDGSKFGLATDKDGKAEEGGYRVENPYYASCQIRRN